jgi:hypothetical protein
VHRTIPFHTTKGIRQRLFQRSKPRLSRSNSARIPKFILLVAVPNNINRGRCAPERYSMPGQMDCLVCRRYAQRVGGRLTRMLQLQEVKPICYAEIFAVIGHDYCPTVA